MVQKDGKSDNPGNKIREEASKARQNVKSELDAVSKEAGNVARQEAEARYG